MNLLLQALTMLAGFVGLGIVGSWWIDKYLYPVRSRAKAHGFEVRLTRKESEH
jgi:hypothetical protein